jgi:ribosomal protein L33
VPESPCKRCGKMTLHTEDDSWPRCEECTKIRWLTRLTLDITSGRLVLPPLSDEEGGIDE